MKHWLLLTAAAVLCGGCNSYDDFAISGTIVDFEPCADMMDLGYAIQLDTPDSTGAEYITSEGASYDNVVVVYGSNDILPVGSLIQGRMYIDERHSDAYCTYHFRNSRGKVPEGVFTELKVK